MNKKDIKHEEPIVPDPIYSLVLGGWKAHILKTALQLDVFSDVHKGLRTVQEIVASKKWQLRAIRMLLDSLCPLGFLAKKDEEYFLTPISEAFLVRDSDTYAGGYVLAALASDTWEQLAEAVRIDPNNENAKYNLELLGEVQAVLTPESPMIIVPVAGFLGGSAGYSGGVVHKGY